MSAKAINEPRLRYPDFAIVGAGKSGTTTLHQILKSHPEVFVPDIKETWFFNLVGNPNKSILNRFSKLPTDLNSYLKLFERAGSNQVCGEVTPSYLYYYDFTIRSMKLYLPNPDSFKIIIILREPLSKIRSHYNFVNSRFIDPEALSLYDALIKEPDRLKKNDLLPDLFYVDNTRYYKQVKAYMDNFKNTKVFLYDELKKNPEGLIEELFEFIGVDRNFKAKNIKKKYNTSSDRIWPRISIMKKLFMRYHYLNKFLPQNLRGFFDYLFYNKDLFDQRVNNMLSPIFKEEVIKLQSLIQKDLSHWSKIYD